MLSQKAWRWQGAHTKPLPHPCLPQPRCRPCCSFLFSPVILLWLLAIGGIGLFNTVVYRPSVVRGLSPHYIWHFFQVGSLQTGPPIHYIRHSFHGNRL